jgi:hypothetical protein
MHIPSAEGNFKEGLKAVKPLLTKDCTKLVDSNDRMANRYSISKGTWKWMKKFFHLLHLTILNSYTVYKSCGGNMTHRKFREQQDLVVSHYVSRSHTSSLQTQMS